MWPGDSRFCSPGCYKSFEDDAGVKVGLYQRTLDDLVFEMLIPDYELAVRELRTISGAPILAHELAPANADYYAEKLAHMTWPQRIILESRGVALREVVVEDEPIQRTRLQEDLRALFVKWFTPQYKTQAVLRADARARFLVDRLDDLRRHEAARLAMRGPPPPNYRLQAELDAHDAEHRYNAELERRRRPKRDPRLTGEKAIYPC